MIDFEKEFEKILESDEYENALESVFMLARTTFKAGIEIAGGVISEEYKIRDFITPDEQNV